MKKIKPTMLNIVLSLTTICLAAGVTLATAHKYTENLIAVSKAAGLQNVIRNVTPEYDNNPFAEMYKIAVTKNDSLTVYPVRMGDKWIGCAVESFSKHGFSGRISIMVGFDEEGKVLDYAVLEHNETPGLGSKMQEWFRTNKNRQSIIGRDMTQGALKTTKDGGDVDAITAATITTRAFLEAVNLAFSAISSGMDATSGETIFNDLAPDVQIEITTQ